MCAPPPRPPLAAMTRVDAFMRVATLALAPLPAMWCGHAAHPAEDARMPPSLLPSHGATHWAGRWPYETHSCWPRTAVGFCFATAHEPSLRMKVRRAPKLWQPTAARIYRRQRPQLSARCISDMTECCGIASALTVAGRRCRVHHSGDTNLLPLRRTIARARLGLVRGIPRMSLGCGGGDAGCCDMAMLSSCLAAPWRSPRHRCWLCLHSVNAHFGSAPLSPPSCRGSGSHRWPRPQLALQTPSLCTARLDAGAGRQTNETASA